MKIRKNNIEKKQSGGIIYTPFVPSYNTSEAESSSSSSSSSDEGKIGDIQKEILDVLQENGLPSDVDTFMKSANRFLRKAEITGEWSMADFTRIQSLANRVAHNKTLYDAATKHLTETGNWNEVALNDKGQMYVQDTENSKILQIDPGEYFKNKNKYVVLTNNDILEFRSNASPFDSSVLNAMSGSVGIDNIVEYAKGIALDFGTRSISGYTNDQVAKMDEALNALISNGPKGYYKYKQEAQNGGGPTIDAILYLYNSLPNNMKQLLRAKTAAEGQDPNVHYTDLLAQILSNHLDSSISVDFDSAATSVGSDGTGSTGQVADTYLRKVSTFANIRPDRVSLVPNTDDPTNQGKLDVTGYRLGPITDRLTDNIDTDKFSLNYLISKAEFVKTGNTDMISMGGRVLKPEEFNKVMINNSTQVIGAVLPYIVDDHGNYIPDFAKVEAFNQWNKFVKDNPNITEMEAEELANQVGLSGDDIEYDYKSKSFKLRNTMQFYGLSAYINSEVVDIDDNMKAWLYHMPKSEGKQLKAEYDNLLVYRTTTPSKTDRKIGDLGFMGKTKDGNANAFYQGMLFIPITNPELGSLLTVHGKVSNEMANDPIGFMTTRQILLHAQEDTNEDIGNWH